MRMYVNAAIHCLVVNAYLLAYVAYPPHSKNHCPYKNVFHLPLHVFEAQGFQSFYSKRFFAFAVKVLISSSASLDLLLIMASTERLECCCCG